MERAASDTNRGEAYPKEIVDGDTVYDNDAIMKYLEEHGLFE
jgi:hypothetical protein